MIYSQTSTLWTLSYCKISQYFISWEQRWPLLEPLFQDPEAGPAFFQEFAELMEKIKYPRAALPLLGLQKHPSLFKFGIKAKLLKERQNELSKKRNSLKEI